MFKKEKVNSELVAGEKKGRPIAKRLAVCGVCIALASVLSIISIFKFPFGGSVTLCSMLFVVIPAWIYGVRTGTISGLVYGLVQFALNPYVISLPQFLLDYILAFSVMGIAGIFMNSRLGSIKGYLAAVLARWIIATCAGLAWVAAGFTFWEGWNPIPYSMAYNGAYIFAETALTIIIIAIPAMRNALEHVKMQCR